jgi:hypothetical protein
MTWFGGLQLAAIATAAALIAGAGGGWAIRGAFCKAAAQETEHDAAAQRLSDANAAARGWREVADESVLRAQATLDLIARADSERRRRDAALTGLLERIHATPQTYVCSDTPVAQLVLSELRNRDAARRASAATSQGADR